MQRVNSSWFRVSSFASIVAAALSAGCGSDSDKSGQLSLHITDAPVDSASNVFVQFSGIEIHGGGGDHHTLYFCQDPVDATKTVIETAECATPKPKQIDLLALTGGESEALLDGIELVAGRYQWIRLMVDTAEDMDSYIVLSEGGSSYELTIPSGDESGLKLNRGFDVAAGGASDFTIDFDLRKSVHEANNGNYILRPTLRIVDNLEVGAIAGTVTTGLVGGCVPAVYVFSGANVTPDDVDGNNVEPVTTAVVKMVDGAFRYKAAFLEAGDYTAAFTCNAGDDAPGTSETLIFSGTSNATVTDKSVTTLNF